MSLIKHPIVLLLLFCFSLSSKAALKAQVDRPSVFLGESLNLSITSDKNTNGQPDFTILDAVFHVGQTGRSSSTKIINGDVSTETTWQVLLVPKSLGNHIIPPIEIDGERTRTIKVEVKKPDPKAQANGDVFIEVEADKTTAFVQEEILLTVRLLYAINLKNGALSDPSADGLIVQAINKGANYNTQRNGKAYQVLERKYAIFAENSGQLSLSPIIFEGEVTDNSRQSFSMFQRGRPIRQVSPMLELEIKQIPQTFISKDWIPAKNITLQQSWSQNKPYQVGEPITRTITLTATGLSETQLPDLIIPEIAGAKIYQDKTDTMTRTDGNQLISSKVIKYAVIPNNQGSLTIPEFSLDWFNTRTQKSQTATIVPTTLQIKAAESGTTGAPAPIDFNQTVKPAKPSLTPVTTAEPAVSDNLKFWQILAAVFAALWLLTLLFFGHRFKQRRPNTQTTTQQNNSVSLKRLNQLPLPQLQSTLIRWWNQEYQQNTTNLGQIKEQLAPGPTQDAVAELQRSLYTENSKKLNLNWHELINTNSFRPTQHKTQNVQGLPELYG